MIDNNKEVTLNSKQSEIIKLEAFIEDICDQYKIFNSYFANIATSIINSFEVIVEHIEKADLEDTEIKIFFRSSKNCLTFEILSQHEVFDVNFHEKSLSELSGNGMIQQLMTVKYLSDEFKIEEDGKKCIIDFHISSINYDKTIERNKHIEDYFKKINIPKKV